MFPCREKANPVPLAHAVLEGGNFFRPVTITGRILRQRGEPPIQECPKGNGHVPGMILRQRGASPIYECPKGDGHVPGILFENIKEGYGRP